MDAQTKIQALQLITAIIQGLGDRDRNVVAIQSDALKAAVRVAKEAATAETCHAAAGEEPSQCSSSLQYNVICLDSLWATGSCFRTEVYADSLRVTLPCVSADEVICAMLQSYAHCACSVVMGLMIWRTARL